MRLIVFFLLMQNQQFLGLEPLNAILFLPNGKTVEVVDIKIKGADPYAFEFRAEGESAFVSLYRVTRITRLEDGKTFELMFDNGRKRRGQISSFFFTGREVARPDDEIRYSVYDLARVHLILGEQLKHCANGDYEDYTPFVFCPVCGRELGLGIPDEDYLGKPRPTAPLHRLRVDPREN